MSNLEHLDLSENRLIKIEENSFTHLRIIKYLNLSGNKLDLESEFNNASYFKSQILLEILDLSDNQINKVDSNGFRGLINLKILDLSMNRLQMFNAVSFGESNLGE